MSLDINGTNYTTFDDLWNQADSLTESEKEEIKLKISLVGKLIEAREKRGLSQRELAKLSGVNQPAIARLETMQVMPQIDTLFKLLKPLGYTLAIVPKEKDESDNIVL